MALLKIMQLNGSGKAKFVITQDGYLNLWLPLDNRGVTPATLRAALEEADARLRNTASAWNTALWTAEGKKASAYHAQVNALIERLRPAYVEFNEALRPALAGGPVDRERLKKALAHLRQTIREVREGVQGLEAPSARPAS